MTAELFREGIRVADGLDTGIEKNRALITDNILVHKPYEILVLSSSRDDFSPL